MKATFLLESGLFYLYVETFGGYFIFYIPISLTFVTVKTKGCPVRAEIIPSNLMQLVLP